MLGLKEIRELQKNGKARRQQGLFVAEGLKLFEEAPAEQIVEVCVSQSFEREHSGVITRKVREIESVGGTAPDGPAEIITISDSRMEKLSDTKTPQGILTVVREKSWAVDRILDGPNPFLLLLENVQDPGNVGTILRTAEAAGVDGVFLTAGCADILSPKVIRSTMGSIYRVPHAVIADPEDLLIEFPERDIISYAAYLDTEVSYLGGDYTGGTCFFIGNESRGLSDSLLNKSDRLIHIPMKGQVESLNAAMAAGILMFEAARQRR